MANDNDDLKTAAKYLRRMLVSVNTDTDAFDEITDAGWKKLFGFSRPADDLSWAAKLVASEDFSTEEIPHGNQEDAAEQYLEALASGMPKQNTLILLADTVDKRKKLYKYLLDTCAIIDLEIDTGASSAARKEQDAVLRDLVNKTLSGYGKRTKPDVVTALIERVGFHPVAIVHESEKLALFADDTDTITFSHLNALVGRTREDALYEFTDAFAGRDYAKALVILSHLQENGVHPLAIIATLKNHVKKMLLVKALQNAPSPHYTHQSYPAFQNSYLPDLKSSVTPWPAMLSGHPFALHKLFCHCEFFSFHTLRNALSSLLEAEFTMKRSSVPGTLLIEKQLFSLSSGSTFNR